MHGNQTATSWAAVRHARTPLELEDISQKAAEAAFRKQPSWFKKMVRMNQNAKTQQKRCSSQANVKEVISCSTHLGIPLMSVSEPPAATLRDCTKPYIGKNTSHGRTSTMGRQWAKWTNSKRYESYNQYHTSLCTIQRAWFKSATSSLLACSLFLVQKWGRNELNILRTRLSLVS